MIIGIDMGASAVKIAALEDGRPVLTHYEPGRGGDIPALCERLGLDLGRAGAVGLTGLSAKGAGLERLGIGPAAVPEAEAIGRGGTFLSGLDDVIVASMGTGTAFVHAKGGVYSHLCGTGVGSGTLSGLARKVLGISDMKAFDALAMSGDTNHVDLTIGDFVEMHGQLAAGLTASNLARRNPDATDADWAAGLCTLVYQVVGTMSLLACRGCGARAVVVTGAAASSGPSLANFRRFTDSFGLDYCVPEHAGFATAMGAALRAAEGAA